MPQPQPLARRAGSGAGFLAPGDDLASGSAVPPSRQQHALVCAADDVAGSRGCDWAFSMFVVLS